MISVILPAHDESGYIDVCLDALLASDLRGATAEVIVVANACTDDTAARARAFAGRAAGWNVTVIETSQPGKLGALNLGEASARGDPLVYLDADVCVSPDLLADLSEVLRGPEARYGSGTPVVTARSRFSSAYARFWTRLPFVAEGVPGFGLFAVNRAGRARWGRFPDIIADDMLVRLHFAPEERIKVAARYRWPMIEGLANLVRVRRRQDRGVQEIAARYPGLMRHAEHDTPGRARVAALALRDPPGFGAYALVKLLVRTRYARGEGWARGR